MTATPKTALITGGGAGIGAAITAALMRDGVRCIITGRGGVRPEGMDDATGYLPLDYLDPASVERAAAEIADRLHPDILINNVGVNSKAPMCDVSPGDLADILSVNLAGPYRVTQACLPHMAAQGWGRIVNISSIWSIVGNPGNTAYCASKFGVDGMTASLAAEVAHKGILVNAVAPGYIMTEIMREKYSDDALATASAHIPVGRPGRPDEVGAFATWLASDANTYITGQNIRIDGGLTRTAHPFTRPD